MDKFNHYIINHIGHLEEIYFKKDPIDDLPRMFHKEYSSKYYKINIKDSTHNIVLLEVKNDKLYSLEKIVSNINRFKDILPGYEIVITYKSLDKEVKKSFIQSGIPFFIYSREEIFLPFVYVHLKKDIQNNNECRRFSPKEQLVFLYLFNTYKEPNLKNLSIKDISNRTKISKSTVQKCFSLLVEHGFLIKIGVTKNAKYFYSPDMKLMKFIKYFMINPISDKLYYELSNIDLSVKNYIYNNGILSSEAALSERTLYTKPDITSYAFEKYDEIYSILEKNNVTPIQSEELANFIARNSEVICIESWLYDPKIISNNKIIDNLSLYKILEASIDDQHRLHQELKKLIFNIIN